MSFTLPSSSSTPASQAADLLTTVQNLGPGTSLAAKVKLIQSDIAARDSAAACTQLVAFINEVQAQAGKRIPASSALDLVNRAEGIETSIPCN
jgi:hypothetical protein